MATAAKPVPRNPGPTRRLLRPRSVRYQQPQEPFLRIAGKGGLPAERRPSRVTAALSSAGGEGAEPGDPPPPAARGMGRGGPKTAGSRSPPADPSGPGSRRGGPAPSRTPPFPARLPRGPHPWGTDTHQSRRRRRLLTPRSLASQQPRRRQRLRDTDPGFVQNHAPSAIPPPHPIIRWALPARAPSRPAPPLGPPASPAGFLPAPSAAPGPPLSSPARRVRKAPRKCAPAPRDAEWALCQAFRMECSIRLNPVGAGWGRSAGSPAVGGTALPSSFPC